MMKPPSTLHQRAERCLRIVLVEDRALRRRAVEARVGTLPGLQIQARFPRMKEALRALPGLRVDALLIGDHLLDDQALAAMRRVRGGVRTRFVAMAPRPVADDDLLSGMPLDAVVHLESDPAVLACALCGAGHRPCPLADLTSREKAVASMRVRGKPLKTIAAELGCTISSVNTHLRRARAKLGSPSFADFVTRCSGLRL